MKSKTDLNLEVSLKTRTSLTVKVAAAVGVLGIIVTVVFFLISHFGSPKTILAEDGGQQTLAGKTIIFSEFAPKGYDGEGDDKFIELYNLTELDINLTGYSIEYYKDGKYKGKYDLSGEIEANDFIVIAFCNDKKEKNMPTENLDYDLLIKSKDWAFGGKMFFQLKNGSDIIDLAGSSENSLGKNNNYDRTDVLSGGGLVSESWTIVDKAYSTPDDYNFSDSEEGVLSNIGDEFEFGKNSNSNPLVKIETNGSQSPGVVKVKANRGKKVESDVNMILRSVDIVPTTQPDNVTLTFYYHDSELNGLDENNLALYSYYDDEWHYIGGEVYDDENKIVVTGVNHFSTWTAGPKMDNSLPIDLVSFEGQYIDNSVLLSWKTATEVNNNFFTVERSEDAVNYEIIGTEIGAGNSNSILSYTMTDSNPFDGVTYYRLTQTDYDGKFEVFPIIAVRCNDIESNNNITIEKFGPNPFTSYVNIKFNSNVSDNVTLNLYNMQGVIVKSINYDCQEGINNIELNGLELLNPGTYLVQIYNDSFNMESIRLIKR